MADDTTQTATPTAPDYTDPAQQAAITNRLLQMTLGGQSAQPQEPAHSGDNRTWGSLLGQALVGGAGPGSTDAANEQAGLRALQSVGLGMMSGSDYSRQRHTLGSIVADAIGGAQQGNYEQQTAMLAYQKQQQEMQLARIKEAVPLLTQLTTLQQQRAVRGLTSSLGDTTAPGANTSIGAVGAPGGPLGPGTAPINAAGDSATRKASEGGPPAPGTPAAKTAQQVHDFWIAQGYSEPVVAGIMAGGPGSESDFNPTVFGDKGTSYGLYQHHGERLDAMKRFFGLSGSQMPTADQQNQYAAWEISPQGPLAKVGAQLKTAQTPADAAAIWTAGFGVPADKSEIGRRAAGAGRFQGLYGQPSQPGAPGAPATAQAPPAGPTAAPGVAQGDIAHPELAPGPPGSTGGAPIGIGAALAPPTVAGTPIPAGKLQSTGKPPGQAAADIIQSGVQLAQETPLVRGTGQEAGPSSAVATLATSPATPQPGWGTGAATGYNTSPTTTAPATPPAAQIPSQATPPPAATPPAVTAPGFTVPDPPQQIRDTFRTDLSPAEEGEFQRRFSDAQRQFQIAQVSNNPKGMEDAQKEISTVRQAMIDARLKRYELGTKAQQDWNSANFTQFNQQQQKQQEFDQQFKLKQAEGEQQRLTNKEAVFNQANQKGLEIAQTEQANARDVVAQLDGFRTISDSVQQPGWLQTTKWPGSNHSIAEQLQQAGIPVSDTAGAQLLGGGITNLVKTLRAGMPMGSLSDRDLDFITRMGPTEWMDRDTRTAAVSYLQQAYRAKMNFARDVQKEMSRGKNYGDAMDAADAKQKPFVPAVPTDLTQHWRDNTGDWPKLRQKWTQDNDVRPGTLYHMADGTIAIARTPKEGGQ